MSNDPFVRNVNPDKPDKAPDLAHGAPGQAHSSGAKLPLGVWRRAPMDWAYRVEVDGYGSIAGVGFSTREEATVAMREARADAEAKIEDEKEVARHGGW